jgi:hypothetical protein
MIYKTTTAKDAVLHFAKSDTWLNLWPGNRNGKNKEYSRCAKIIQDAQAGKVSDERARGLLWTYGGLAYRVSSTFEVAVKNPCIHCGAECVEEWLEYDVKGEANYSYPAMVCTADPEHVWQSGKQMDATIEVLKTSP